jgi:N-acetyl-anhydromuramyl-L-alanine amidase AmpD
MANLTGEATQAYVTQQVQQRQNIQGKLNKSNEELQYLTNKNAFVRLASSVVVENDIKKQGFPGSELAKKFVLFNGVTEIQHSYDENGNISSTQTQRAGILNSNSPEAIKNNNNVYGVGGLEFGLSPMMGITQVNIKSLTRGSLKEATVDIIANNREQFEIIESLYIKLGYNMLLEWGWTNYFDNNGTYISPTENSYTLVPKFLQRNIGYDGFLNLIKQEREKSNGNYDAFLGRVVNFSWKFNKNGQYVITLILRSIGDVIESFKANTLMPSDKKLLSQKQEDAKNKEKKAQEDKEKNNQAQYNAKLNLYAANNLIQDQDNLGGQYQVEYYIDENNNPQKIQNSSPKFEAQEAARELVETTEAKRVEIEKELQEAQQELNELLGIKSTIQAELSRLLKKIDKLSGPTVTLSTFIDEKKRTTVVRKKYQTPSISKEGEDIIATENQYYVSLGYLLYFIQKQLIPFDTKYKSRVINFDLDYEKTLTLLPPYIFPGSPSQCSINVPIDTTGNFILSKKIPNFIVKKGKRSYGKLLNVFFNYKVINNLLSNSTITLVDFFQKLINVYTKSIGSFNDISVTVDAETNYMKFIDETTSSTEDLDKNVPTSKFNTYGYLGTQSNFIRNLDFTTTVSPSLSMMITAGSTKSGYYPGYDATGLSTLNRGYVDYMKENLNNGEPSEVDLKKDTNDLVKEKYALAIDVIGKFKSKLNEGFLDPELESQIPSNLNNLIKAQTFFATRKQQITNPDTQSPNIGFIPFDASLTLDGISGIKIYNRIEFSQEFLPSNYPNNLKFLVKGIDHNISNNDWTTTLTTFAIPKNPFSGAPVTTDPLSILKKIFGDSSKGNSDPSTWTDKTITSGFPLNPSGHQNGPFAKTQIVLHYSAGWQRTDKGKSTVETLNQRPNKYKGKKPNKTPVGWGLSYHYIIDAAGHVEQLIEDTDRAFAAGDANHPSINISLQNIGYKRSQILNSSGNLSQPDQTPLVKLVGPDGKTEKTYRGKDSAQEITDAQLVSLKKLYRKLLSKHEGIVQNGFDFDKLFPKNTTWKKSEPGFYTHCSVTTEKLDCLPTPKIVNFFKEISNPPELSQREKVRRSYTNFQSLARDIQDIFKLRDNFGISNNPLFKPYKGGNDNEKSAAIAFQKWFRQPEQKKRLGFILDPDNEHFVTKVNLIIKEMQENIADDVTFKSSVGGSTSYFVNTNF